MAAAIPSVKVADTEYNIKQIEDFVAQAEGRGVEIIVFPELSVTGYSCFYSSYLLNRQRLR